MITIDHHGQGKCLFCFQDHEGVRATFPDGLHGFLCQKHFWQALRVRMSTGPSQPDAAEKSTTAKPPASKPS